MAHHQCFMLSASRPVTRSTSNVPPTAPAREPTPRANTEPTRASRIDRNSTSAAKLIAAVAAMSSSLSSGSGAGVGRGRADSDELRHSTVELESSLRKMSHDDAPTTPRHATGPPPPPADPPQQVHLSDFNLTDTRHVPFSSRSYVAATEELDPSVDSAFSDAKVAMDSLKSDGYIFRCLSQPPAPENRVPEIVLPGLNPAPDGCWWHLLTQEEFNLYLAHHSSYGSGPTHAASTASLPSAPAASAAPTRAILSLANVKIDVPAYDPTGFDAWIFKFELFIPNEVACIWNRSLRNFLVKPPSATSTSSPDDLAAIIDYDNRNAFLYRCVFAALDAANMGNLLRSPSDPIPTGDGCAALRLLQTQSSKSTGFSRLHAFAEFYRLRQLPSESLIAYMSRLQEKYLNVCKHEFSLPDLLSFVLLTGVQPQYKDVVSRLAVQETLPTPQNILNELRAHEQRDLLAKVDALSNPVLVAAAVASYPHSSARDRSASPSRGNVVCYRCGSPDHISSSDLCPHRSRGVARDTSSSPASRPATYRAKDDPSATYRSSEDRYSSRSDLRNSNPNTRSVRSDELPSRGATRAPAPSSYTSNGSHNQSRGYTDKTTYPRGSRPDGSTAQPPRSPRPTFQQSEPRNFPRDSSRDSAVSTEGKTVSFEGNNRPRRNRRGKHTANAVTHTHTAFMFRHVQVPDSTGAPPPSVLPVPTPPTRVLPAPTSHLSPPAAPAVHPDPDIVTRGGVQCRRVLAWGDLVIDNPELDPEDFDFDAEYGVAFVPLDSQPPPTTYHQPPPTTYIQPPATVAAVPPLTAPAAFAVPVGYFPESECVRCHVPLVPGLEPPSHFGECAACYQRTGHCQQCHLTPLYQCLRNYRCLRCTIGSQRLATPETHSWILCYQRFQHLQQFLLRAECFYQQCVSFINGDYDQPGTARSASGTHFRTLLDRDFSHLELQALLSLVFPHSTSRADLYFPSPSSDLSAFTDAQRRVWLAFKLFRYDSHLTELTRMHDETQLDLPPHFLDPFVQWSPSLFHFDVVCSQ